MRIRTVEELDQLESLIGAQNVREGKRLLQDGGKMWIFRTPEELKACTELTEREKEQCEVKFEETRGEFAGWFQEPPRTPPPYIPGFSVSPNHDSHGNFRPRGGSSGPKFSH